MAEVMELKKTTGRSTIKRATAQESGTKLVTRARKSPAKNAELDKVYEALDLSRPDGQDTDSLEQLSTLINRAVGKRSDRIARKLTQMAEEGNLTSAKLIMELVSKKKLTSKASANGFLKLVRSLESQPEYVEPEAQ